MNYSGISFDEVRTEIERIFPGSQMHPKYLDPSSIINCAQSVGIKLPMRQFKDWESFEYGHLDLSDEDFFIQLFNTTEPKFGQTIVVTDPCFADKLGYKIQEGYLLEFVKEVYSELHDEEFFQPLDIIFVFPDVKSLTCLHHEGWIIEYNAK